MSHRPALGKQRPLRSDAFKYRRKSKIKIYVAQEGSLEVSWYRSLFFFSFSQFCNCLKGVEKKNVFPGMVEFWCGRGPSFYGTIVQVWDGIKYLSTHPCRQWNFESFSREKLVTK